jgi:hypothetical protein
VERLKKEREDLNNALHDHKLRATETNYVREEEQQEIFELKERIAKYEQGRSMLVAVTYHIRVWTG